MLTLHLFQESAAQHVLHPVTCDDLYPPPADDMQQQQPVVCVGAADAPPTEELHGESAQLGVRAPAVHVLQCDHRDLNLVLFLGADPKAYSLQPENALPVKSYKMEDGDTALLDLMPLLEAVVKQQAPDVRKVVAAYKVSLDGAAGRCACRLVCARVLTLRVSLLLTRTGLR